MDSLLYSEQRKIKSNRETEDEEARRGVKAYPMFVDGRRERESTAKRGTCGDKRSYEEENSFKSGSGNPKPNEAM